MFKTYYQLTKPGIIYGNALTTTAGFLLASKGHINVGLFLAVLVGVSLIIGSACVFNNYIDRDIDSKMVRTKKRALVTGLIPAKNALIFGGVLGFVGLLLLVMFTNFLTVLLGLIAYIFYVVLYGMAKRHTVHSTVVGSIAGAMPPVAGYTAVTNRFDLGAGLLFLILIAWQMPHFYAIAIYRLREYKAAGLPILPAKKGLFITKLQILFYIFVFIITALSLTIFGYTGYLYLVIMAVLGMVWFLYGIQGFSVNNNGQWARKMFFFSLIVTLSFSFLLAFNAWLP